MPTHVSSASEDDADLQKFLASDRHWASLSGEYLNDFEFLCRKAMEVMLTEQQVDISASPHADTKSIDRPVLIPELLAANPISSAQLQAFSDQLSSKLSEFASQAATGFDVVMRERIVVVKRMRDAMRRNFKRASQQLTARDPAVPQGTTSLPVMVSLGLSMFFAFVQSLDVASPASVAVLDTMTQLLATYGPLSLYTEDAVTLDNLTQWLSQAAACSPKALSALVVTALARGSLHDLLKCVERLLQVEQTLQLPNQAIATMLHKTRLLWPPATLPGWAQVNDLTADCLLGSDTCHSFGSDGMYLFLQYGDNVAFVDTHRIGHVVKVITILGLRYVSGNLAIVQVTDQDSQGAHYLGYELDADMTDLDTKSATPLFNVPVLPNVCSFCYSVTERKLYLVVYSPEDDGFLVHSTTAFRPGQDTKHLQTLDLQTLRGPSHERRAKELCDVCYRTAAPAMYRCADCPVHDRGHYDLCEDCYARRACSEGHSPSHTMTRYAGSEFLEALLKMPKGYGEHDTGYVASYVNGPYLHLILPDETVPARVYDLRTSPSFPTYYACPHNPREHAFCFDQAQCQFWSFEAAAKKLHRWQVFSGVNPKRSQAIHMEPTINAKDLLSELWDLVLPFTLQFDRGDASRDMDSDCQWLDAVPLREPFVLQADRDSFILLTRLGEESLGSDSFLNDMVFTFLVMNLGRLQRTKQTLSVVGLSAEEIQRLLQFLWGRLTLRGLSAGRDVSYVSRALATGLPSFWPTFEKQQHLLCELRATFLPSSVDSKAEKHLQTVAEFLTMFVQRLPVFWSQHSELPPQKLSEQLIDWMMSSAYQGELRLSTAFERALLWIQQQLVAGEHYDQLREYCSFLLPRAVEFIRMAAHEKHTAPFKLEDSFICTVISSLMNWLCQLVSNATQSDDGDDLHRRSCLSDVFEETAKLFAALCDVMSWQSEQAQDQAYLQLAKQLHTVTLVVEDDPSMKTPVHADQPNPQQRDKLVHIPGAKRLLISFDKSSHTEQNWSYVRIYRGSNRSESVAQFHGAFSRWPQKPVVITGDTCVISFINKTDNNDWAYRATVAAEFAGAQAPDDGLGRHKQMSDLLRSCGWLLGKCAGELVRFVPKPLEQKHHELWSSGLLQPACHYEMYLQFLNEVLHADGTNAEAFLQSLANAVHTPAPRGGASFDYAERAVFVLILFHTETLSDAAQFASSLQGQAHSLKPPARLQQLWRAANRIRQWMLQQYQTRNAAAADDAASPAVSYEDVSKHVIERAEYLMSKFVEIQPMDESRELPLRRQLSAPDVLSDSLDAQQRSPASVSASDNSPGQVLSPHYRSQATPASIAPTPSVLRFASQVNPMKVVKRSDSDEASHFVELRSLYKVLRQKLHVPRDEVSSALFDTAIGNILRFVQDDASLEEYDEICQVRSQRGQDRKLAFEKLADCILHCPLQSIVHDLIRWVPTALKSLHNVFAKPVSADQQHTASDKTIGRSDVIYGVGANTYLVNTAFKKLLGASAAVPPNSDTNSLLWLQYLDIASVMVPVEDLNMVSPEHLLSRLHRLLWLCEVAKKQLLQQHDQDVAELADALSTTHIVDDSSASDAEEAHSTQSHPSAVEIDALHALGDGPQIEPLAPVNSAPTVFPVSTTGLNAASSPAMRKSISHHVEIHEAAWIGFKFIALQLSRTTGHKALDSLCGMIVERLAVYAMLFQNERQSNVVDSRIIGDETCYKLLGFVHCLLCNAELSRLFADRAVGRLLCLLQYGSPRVQQLSLSLLRVLLPATTPEKVSTDLANPVKLSEFAQEYMGEELLPAAESASSFGMIALQLVGHLSTDDAARSTQIASARHPESVLAANERAIPENDVRKADSDSASESSVDAGEDVQQFSELLEDNQAALQRPWRDQFASKALSYNVCVLYRSLLAIDSWRSELHSLLILSLQHASDTLRNLPNSAPGELVQQYVGALSVVGGVPPVLGVGVSVTTSTGAMAVVVRYHPNVSSVKIVLAGSDRISEADASELTVLSSAEETLPQYVDQLMPLVQLALSSQQPFVFTSLRSQRVYQLMRVLVLRCLTMVSASQPGAERLVCDPSLLQQLFVAGTLSVQGAVEFDVGQLEEMVSRLQGKLLEVADGAVSAPETRSLPFALEQHPELPTKWIVDASTEDSTVVCNGSAQASAVPEAVTQYYFEVQFDQTSGVQTVRFANAKFQQEVTPGTIVGIALRNQTLFVIRNGVLEQQVPCQISGRCPFVTVIGGRAQANFGAKRFSCDVVALTDAPSADTKPAVKKAPGKPRKTDENVSPYDKKMAAKMRQLQNLGFEERVCYLALLRNAHDVQRAALWLTEHAEVTHNVDAASEAGDADSEGFESTEGSDEGSDEGVFAKEEIVPGAKSDQEQGDWESFSGSEHADGDEHESSDDGSETEQLGDNDDNATEAAVPAEGADVGDGDADDESLDSDEEVTAQRPARQGANRVNSEEQQIIDEIMGEHVELTSHSGGSQSGSDDGSSSDSDESDSDGSGDNDGPRHKPSRILTPQQISIGMPLQVTIHSAHDNPCWVQENANVVGRIGVVHEVREHPAAVRLRFDRSDSGSRLLLWIPLRLVERTSKSTRVEVPMIDSLSSVADVLQQMQLMQQTLAQQYIRRACVGVLAQAPKTASSVDNFMLKHLVVREVGQHMPVPHARLAHDEIFAVVPPVVHSADVDAIQTIAGTRFAAEEQQTRAATDGTWYQYLQTLVPRNTVEAAVSSSDTPQIMRKKAKGKKKGSKPKLATPAVPTPVPEATTVSETSTTDTMVKPAEVVPPTLACYLTDYVIRALLQNAGRVGHSIHTEESKHPHEPNMELTKRFIFPGHRALRIEFHTQCRLRSGRGFLHLYQDLACNQLIESFTGHGTTEWHSVVVEGDRFAFRFLTDARCEWGFKFTVTPILPMATDERLSNGPQLDVALCILQLLLAQPTELVPCMYTNAMCTALLAGLMYPKNPLEFRRWIALLLAQLQRQSLHPAIAAPVCIDGAIVRKHLLPELDVISDNDSNGDTLSLACAMIEAVAAMPVPTYLTDAPVFEDELSDAQLAIEVSRCVVALQTGAPLPERLLHESWLSMHQGVQVIQSPHPYGAGFTSAGCVHVAHAKQMEIIYDMRTNIHPEDELSLSAHSIGDQDINCITERVQGQSSQTESTSRVYYSFTGSNGGDQWGYLFGVVPKFGLAHAKKVLRQHSEEVRQFVALQQQFTVQADRALANLVTELCDKTYIDPRLITLEDLSAVTTASVLAEIPSLQAFSPEQLFARFCVLRVLNALFVQTSHILDTSLDEPWTMAGCLSQLRELLHFNAKVQVLDEAMEATQTDASQESIQLNRTKAAHAVTAVHGKPVGPNDPFPQCVFVQMLDQVSGLADASVLRQDGNSFEVQLIGEGAQDAGGPFSDALAGAITDLHTVLPLLVRCPNNVHNTGENRDKWVPNTLCVSARCIGYFEFIGLLMGIALRSRNQIALNFPSIVWKPLVNSPVTLSDVRAIDELAVSLIDAMRNPQLTREQFEEFFGDSRFVTQNSIGAEVELFPNGALVPVTYENRLEYLSLVEQFRVSEFAVQTTAIRRGLCALIPAQTLSVFTWNELQVRVCGRPEIDIDLLKLHTDYERCSPDDRHVKLFWKALRSFTQDERAAFLRFVWGRSRLPPPTEFDVHFALHEFPKKEGMNASVNVSSTGDNASDATATTGEDAYLPEAHTCFFQLCLPRYSSLEIMKRKLLFACENCRSIDTDYAVHDADLEANADN